MATLIVQARLLTVDDKALANLRVSVESFDLSSRAWKTIATGQSNRAGIVKTTIDLRQISMGKVGPALRLVEGSAPDRVIAAGAMLEVLGQERNIVADFGSIEILGEASFPRANTEGEERGTVAGVVYKKGLSQATLLRRSDTVTDAGPGRDTVVTGSGDLLRDSVSGASLDPRVSAELQTLHSINLDNTAKLVEKDRLIANRDHELRLKSSELEDALARARTAETRLADVQLGARGEPAQIDAVLSNIGTKIGAASSILKSSANPFRIGSIKVDLKGSLADDGRIFLGGDGGDGSGFSVEMSPDEAVASGDVEVTVPDVSGLTQSAARRVLRSIGLRLSAASQSMAQGAATHGQSLRQTPAAGEKVAHGSEVIVVFADISKS